MSSRAFSLARLLATSITVVFGLSACSPSLPKNPGELAASRAITRLEHLEILSREDAFAGRSFGEVGVYERIVGVAHLRIDPRDPANQIVADLDKAPRGSDGWVHYSVDVIILRPKALQGRSQVLLYDVANRGTPFLLSMANDTNPFGPSAQAPGNGFLLREGFTLVWSGWQGDISDPHLLKAQLPVASDHGKTITGSVQQEIVFDNSQSVSTLTLSYSANSLNQNDAHLTVRANQQSTPRELPISSWRYNDEKTVFLNRPTDMDAGAIYDFTYVAKNPVVMGLGFAATRDLIAFLRYSTRDGEGSFNPLLELPAACSDSTNGPMPQTCGQLQPNIEMALAIGFSQSGRYLRDWLWQGFNADAQNRIVFDGIAPVIAGSRKTFTNVRWAQPGRFSRQHEDHAVYGNQFPFSYGVTTDPLTGAEDGLLKRCELTHTCPKIFHIDTSAEFWQGGSALVATDGAGHDIALPDNVRAYMVAGACHYPVAVAPVCQNPGNTLSYNALVRALLVDLREWVAGRSAPPPSRWPSIGGGTLADPAQQSAVGFPDLTPIGMNYLGVVNPIELSDFSQVPARLDPQRHWQAWVPTTDADGNDVAGVHVPAVAVPLGTYLGWNLRKSGFAEGNLCFLYGSYQAFESDRFKRFVAHDPRQALNERYTGAADYIAKVEAAALQLEADKLLLPEDAQAAIRQAQAVVWPQPAAHPE